MLNGKRIFVVEDNLENRIVIQMLLHEAGAEVICDSRGSKVVSRLQRASPLDIILLDLMLPNFRSGDKLFEKIRQEPEFDDIPIVAVSASNPTDVIPRLKELGFAGFIGKPLSFENFAQYIAQILDGATIWEE